MIESTNDDDDESVIYHIVKGIAEETGEDVCDIEPLHESVDPDALESIFSRADPGVKVVFNHAGQEVRVEKGPGLQVTVV